MYVLLDSVFVISRIIKVSVRVISLSQYLLPRPIIVYNKQTYTHKHMHTHKRTHIMARIKEISTEQNNIFLKRIFDEIFRLERGRSFQKYLPITVGQNFLMYVLKEGIIVEKFSPYNINVGACAEIFPFPRLQHNVLKHNRTYQVISFPARIYQEHPLIFLLAPSS